ncbi:MAG: phosphoribosylamine--glycine ligase [Frankiales bacterium]|nr:phosphoribosylamine--glycine ligase [Frankiales bacterium]
MCLALAADPAVTALVCAPGNAGTAQVAEHRPVDPLDPRSVTDLARSVAAELVVIGPEAPLVAGVADAVRAAGIAVFGPSAAAAQLEGSKAFAKEIMAAAGVPTARAVVITGGDGAAEALDDFGPPYVVKDDGLAAGKGVVVTGDRQRAIEHAVSSPRVVIEEFLDGPEVSLFCVTDGSTVVPLLPAQDFKRIFDDDAGPNTGGMGAYCPLDWLPLGTVDEVVRTVAQPTVDELSRRGTPFVGLLYVGLAMTRSGPRVIEFNARFGDPETQVVLALLETPLAGLLYAAATGTLAGHPPLQWSAGAAVTVVIAAANYPEQPRLNDAIVGGDQPGVIHAGTRRDGDGVLRSAGGRVLSATAVGDDLEQARTAAYHLVDRIELAGGQHRTDIAARAARHEVAIPAGVVMPGPAG